MIFKGNVLSVSVSSVNNVRVSCFAQPLVLPPSLKDNLLDFGVCSATHTSSIIFVVVNSNPIEVRRHTNFFQ